MIRKLFIVLLVVSGSVHAETVIPSPTAAVNSLDTRLSDAANGQGADKIANASRSFASVADLLAYPKPALTPGRTLVATLYGYLAGSTVGGGQVRWDATSAATHDGCKVFNPTGNASTGRWVRVGKTLFSPDECGARGDGVANDTVAVQAAAVAFAADGLVLTTGKTYRVLSAIAMTGNLSGGGELLVDANNTSGITYSGKTDFIVSGVKIRGSQTRNLFAGSSAGISIVNGARFEVRDSEVSFFTDAISVSNSAGFEIARSSLHDVGQEPIVVRYSTAWSIRNNDAFAHNGDGILLKGEGEQGGVIEGNTIRDGVNSYGHATIGGGITCNAEGSEASPMRGLRIINNRVKSTAYGIVLIAATDFVISGNRVSNITGTKGIAVDDSGVFNKHLLSHGRGLIVGNSVSDIADDEGIVFVTKGAVPGLPTSIVSNYINLGNTIQNAIRAQSATVTGNVVTGGLVNIDVDDSVVTGNLILGNPGSADSGVKLRGVGTFTDNLFGTLDARHPSNVQVAANFRGTIANNTFHTNTSQPVITVVDGARGSIRSNYIDNVGAGLHLSRSGGGALQSTIDTDGGTQRSIVSQYASSAPTAGTWAVGSLIYNNAPTAGGFIGWVCTAAGTPGTWKTFGAISP